MQLLSWLLGNGPAPTTERIAAGESAIADELFGISEDLRQARERNRERLGLPPLVAALPASQGARETGQNGGEIDETPEKNGIAGRAAPTPTKKGGR